MKLTDYLNPSSLRAGIFFRYDLSPIWYLHQDYFLNTGLKAWSKGDIPYTGVSNYFEAYKKALLFIENLKQRDEVLDLRVLEIGSGNGEFAKNFLLAFRDICELQGLGFYSKLSYVISDFSEKTLSELKSSSRLPSELRSQIEFQLIDAMNFPAGIQQFDLIMANYLLDQFPARVIAKTRDGFCEKYMSFEPPTKSKYKVKKLKKYFDFRMIDIYMDIPKPHLDLILNCFKPNKESTMVYSYNSLKVLESMMNNLAEDGLIICSDFHASTRAGCDNYEPCYYGNSLAMPVNFEFLYKYFKYSQKVFLYEDPIKPLHTLVLTKPNYPHTLTLGAIYENVYKQNVWLRILLRFLIDIKQGFKLLIIIIVGFLVLHWQDISNLLTNP